MATMTYINLPSYMKKRFFHGMSNKICRGLYNRFTMDTQKRVATSLNFLFVSNINKNYHPIVLAWEHTT